MGIYKRIALGDESDITTITSVPTYKLGEIVQIVNKDNANPEVLSEFLYIKQTTEINKHQPIVILQTVELDAEVVGIAPSSTQSSPIELVGVPQESIPEGSYGFVQIKGNALVDTFAFAGNINIGDPLHLISTEVELKPFGNPDETVALALAFLGTGQLSVSFPVLMLGNKVAIA